MQIPDRREATRAGPEATEGDGRRRVFWEKEQGEWGQHEKGPFLRAVCGPSGQDAPWTGQGTPYRSKGLLQTKVPPSDQGVPIGQGALYRSKGPLQVKALSTSYSLKLLCVQG